MDQQFRLKWNNHCNTLLQVFGNLLKTETLVDCTIGADGQYLKAHKVVVSACSPYFQSLFTEHFDKHPIIILKDIKFTELQSMIDYMYEGEVNISQDQLPSFLKAAASIQLKGLTQNVKAETPLENAAKPLPQLNSARQSGGLLSNGQMPGGLPLNVELEEGQQRKKRKMDTHPPSSASSSPSLVPDLVVPNVILDVPGENNGSGGGGNTPNGQSQGAGGNNGQNNDSMKKEPSEYSGRSDDEEEDGISHDGWDLSNDGLQDSNSTLSAGDRSGPGALHHATPGGNRSAGGPGALSATGGPDMSNVDENNQGYLMSLYPPFTEEVMRHECHQCGRSYKWRSSLKSHLQNECGKEPRFVCPHCPYRCKVRSNLFKHLRNYHKTYIAPLKKEWRRQQSPDMLSMIPPQPQPYNLCKVEKIESSPLISAYNTGQGNHTSPSHTPSGGNYANSIHTTSSGNFANSGGSYTGASGCGGYPMHSPSHGYGGPISPPVSIPGSPSATKNSSTSPPSYQSSPGYQSSPSRQSSPGSTN